ncbi:MAG: glycosyltransferase family 39 protein [Holosporales bacterium]|jgi:4-amino-4-deoxy-L-arabinose transferase-like glycosyltransferase|nr:glycosyltransferase family 39 protein [Holosporales bacterium]
MSTTSFVARTFWKDIGLLCTFLVCFFSYDLGNRPFATPDEGRYVEIPREMVVTGDLITPRLNGVKYFEKPPLFYWLQVGAIRTCGIHFWSMRLWPMLFAILGCLMVYIAGHVLFSRHTGLYAAGILSTTLLYYVHSRLIILDLVVSIFISTTLLLAYGSLQSLARKKEMLLGAYACAALACLTKGLIGIVLPGLVFVVWLILKRDMRIILNLFSFGGIAVFLAIAAPWHIWVCLRNADFAYFYFIGEHFLRYTTNVHQRFQPFLFFAPVLILGVFPWTSAIGSAIRDLFDTYKKRKALVDQEVSSYETTLFLAVWSGVVFLFFSFSHSKLIPYILPIFPSVALLGGQALRKREESQNPYAFYHLGYIDVVLTVILCGYGIYELLEDTQLKALFLTEALRISIFSLVAVSLPFFFKGMQGQFLKALTWTFVLISLNTIAPKVQEKIKSSIKPLTEAVALNVRPQDRVFCLEMYYQDLPVYLNQLVDVAGWKGELAFGIHAEDTSYRMMPSQDFWSIFQGKQRVFVFTRKSIYERYWQQLRFSHKILAETEQDIVFINR